MRHLLTVLAISVVLAGCGGSMPPPTIDGGSDDGGGGDAGLKPFGVPCADNSECESNVCFIGGNRTFCSLHCTSATQATDCPVPPTSGMCNMQGYCKP
jgi:hypothetical protein